MDKQHQNLIDIINQLHEAMRSGKATKELSAILEKMILYTDKHFEAEEKILSVQNYPKLAGQKASHVAFVKKTHEFVDKNSKGQLAQSIAVSTFLKDWWTSHIQAEDKQYGAFLNAKGIK